MNIAESLQDNIVPISSLKPHPDNPRRGNVEGIKASLTRFGQVRPILTMPDGTIVAGKHTYEGACELGADAIAAIAVDFSPEDAKAYLLADNKLADDATYDDQALLTILNDVMQNNYLDGTGWSPDSVEDLAAQLEQVATTQAEEFQGAHAEPPEATAERWADRNEGQSREVVFLLPHEDYAAFKERVTDLKEHYGLESMAQTIAAAVYNEWSQAKAVA